MKMAKMFCRVRSVVSVFSICLVLIYNCNNNFYCVAHELSEPTFYYYDVSASYLPQINVNEPQHLKDDQHYRARREASTDAKNQYESVTQNGSNIAVSGSATVAAAGSSSSDAAVTTLNVPVVASPGDSSGGMLYNVGNVGVNGTGQRKNLTETATVTAETTVINAQSGEAKKLGQTQIPKKVATTVLPMPVNAGQGGTPSHQSSIATTTIAAESNNDGKSIIDEVDKANEKTEQEANELKLITKEDHHVYYNSSTKVDNVEANRIWNTVKNITFNPMLSQSHRRAMTVTLNFDFPFYGHMVRNITIATGGFIYTGEYVHSWLAATQYIAPLMANFDTSISNDSYVRMNDTGSAFTVVWENVVLQDKPTYGKFTFSATLHKNGNVVFTYFNVPIMIDAIQDNQHPVKVGLSDAYIIDKQYYFTRRKTIYEYHRVTFSQNEITNGTIIHLTALPTCLTYTECSACINHNTSFECVWCPLFNRCSTGTDRKKQEWIAKGCENAQISDAQHCPDPGARGNNAENGAGGNTATGNSETTHTPGNGSGANSGGSTTSSPPANSTQAQEFPGGQKQRANELNAASASASADSQKNVGVAFGFMVPICLVFAVTLWLFYAYRNPHTRSGQLLIQFRPSQWSWRRGEARYTAATIHM